MRDGRDDPQELRDAINALCREAEQRSGAGRGHEALELLWRAKRLCDRLPGPDRMTDADLHCLSTTTMWLAVELHRTGDTAAGVEIARDLVAAARSAAAVAESIRLDCLGTGLIWLCCWFDGTEEGADALATVRETVRLHRTLAAEEPELTRPALSRALNRLAELLEQSRDHAGALHALCEATALRRELVAERPRTYLASLAEYASRLASLADRVDDDQEARLAAVREAVLAHRVAAERDPGRYAAWLAGSLSVLLAVLESTAGGWSDGAAQHPPELLELAGEVVRVRRGILVRHADDAASWRALTSALHDFSRHAMRAGEWGEAVAASREAVMIHRELGDVGAFGAELLTRLAFALLRTDRTREARAACDEARVLLLSADRPDFAALGRLSGVNALLWAERGDRPAAVAACREQIDFLTTAEAGAPTRDVVAWLCAAWDVMSELLAEEGEAEQAARAGRRARDYRRRLAGGGPAD